MNIFPLPEALDGNHWTVEQGTGSCDTVSRTLLVPMGDSSSDRFVRNHEMAHAKITPRHSASKLAEKYGLSMDAMQVAEDLRVHRFLHKTGVECSGALSEQEMVLYVDKCKTSVRKIALLLLASLYTEDYVRAVDALRSRISEDSLNTILEKVQLVDRRMNSARNLFRPIGFKNATAPAAKLFDALFPADETISASTSEITDALPLKAMMNGDGRSGKSRAASWGTLSIKTLPSTLLRHVPAIARQKAYRDEGVCLSAVHRLPVDGRIFTRFKPQLGGTVLIDGSGSMNLSRTDLEKIVTTAPASTLALYSGRGTSGTLTIIGKRGRVADADGLSKARIGNGNIVDGPALEWLGKQAEPRILVSDGFVTGKHDRASVDLGAEAQVLCNKFRIQRVAKPEAVCGFFAASRRGRNKK
jgi:hypothetical protein